MPRTITCGSPDRATEFDYDGTINDGITLHFDAAADVLVTPELLIAIRGEFAGQEGAEGFSMDNPTPGGLGEWVRDHLTRLNGRGLMPRHVSFIAAILRDAGWVTSRLQGNAVYLQFAP